MRAWLGVLALFAVLAGAAFLMLSGQPGVSPQTGLTVETQYTPASYSYSVYVPVIVDTSKPYVEVAPSNVEGGKYPVYAGTGCYSESSPCSFECVGFNCNPSVYVVDEGSGPMKVSVDCGDGKGIIDYYVTTGTMLTREKDGKTERLFAVDCYNFGEKSETDEAMISVEAYDWVGNHMAPRYFKGAEKLCSVPKFYSSHPDSGFSWGKFAAGCAIGAVSGGPIGAVVGCSIGAAGCNKEIYIQPPPSPGSSSTSVYATRVKAKTSREDGGGCGTTTMKIGVETSPKLKTGATKDFGSNTCGKTKEYEWNIPGLKAVKKVKASLDSCTYYGLEYLDVWLSRSASECNNNRDSYLLADVGASTEPIPVAKENGPVEGKAWTANSIDIDESHDSYTDTAKHFDLNTMRNPQCGDLHTFWLEDELVICDSIKVASQPLSKRFELYLGPLTPSSEYYDLSQVVREAGSGDVSGYIKIYESGQVKSDSTLLRTIEIKVSGDKAPYTATVTIKGKNGAVILDGATMTQPQIADKTTAVQNFPRAFLWKDLDGDKSWAGEFNEVSIWGEATTSSTEGLQYTGCTRGFDGSTALSHYSGAKVEYALRYYGYVNSEGKFVDRGGAFCHYDSSGNWVCVAPIKGGQSQCA